MITPHIDTLRQHLMDTLADLRNKDKPMEPDRALAVAKVASVLVDTARVEIDFLKATGRDQSNFLQAVPSGKSVDTNGLPNGIKSVTRHRIGS